MAQDQKRQDDELKVLEGEIEQLAPSFERGAWNYDDGDGIAQGTEYVLSGVQSQEAYDAAKAPLDAELVRCKLKLPQVIPLQMSHATGITTKP